MRVSKYLLFLALILPFNVATSSFKENKLQTIYKTSATNNKINTDILKAVCEIESNHNLKLKKVWDGGSYSYGICQVKLGTARFMGFKGKESELMKPEVNVEYAAKYLAYQLKRYNNDYKKAIVAYNRGSYSKEEVKSYSGKVALAFLNMKLKGK